MRFELTADQRDFMTSLDRLISASDPIAVNRAWGEGDTAPGLALWKQLAAMGVPALLEDASPVELVCAFEVLGRHVVPGPWIESAAYLATALSGDAHAAVAEGAVATVAIPLALDADIADIVYRAPEFCGTVHRSDEKSGASARRIRASVDPSRRLFEVEAAEPLESVDIDRAQDLASLAAAAELLGAGERVLADAVEYVKQRTQFGRQIGSYQAIKHHLANVRIALDFARPLVHGAAVDPSPRAVSAAKVQAGEAARLAARIGLQVHGAIGYTAEYDLSRWLLRIRALDSAWGTRAAHRSRLLTLLTATEPS